MCTERALSVHVACTMHARSVHGACTGRAQIQKYTNTHSLQCRLHWDEVKSDIGGGVVVVGIAVLSIFYVLI